MCGSDVPDSSSLWECLLGWGCLWLYLLCLPHEFSWFAYFSVMSYFLQRLHWTFCAGHTCKCSIENCIPQRRQGFGVIAGLWVWGFRVDGRDLGVNEVFLGVNVMLNICSDACGEYRMSWEFIAFWFSWPRSRLSANCRTCCLFEFPSGVLFVCQG